MGRSATGRIRSAVHEAIAARNGLAIAAALQCIEPGELAEFFHPQLDNGSDVNSIGEGLPASPGAVSGTIVMSADEAMRARDAGRDVILVRPETTPDDILGMQASAGILTSRGGLASHAAVVARGWGIPAVVGATDVHVDGDTVTIGDHVLHAGDELTIDGASGKIYPGILGTSGSEPPPELATLLSWADAVALGHVQVRANADTRDDASHGRELGAQGIGLCRTEHMFLAHDRLPIMRRFILARDAETEAASLAELEAVQIHDFEQLLDAMDTLPVTVRLLDPPLHEFLPDQFDLIAKEARGDLTDDERDSLTAVRRLHEANPMIGTRGVRLGIVRRGLYEMQVRALCTAAANLFERGRRPHVEIMIPLVVEAEELRIARGWVRDVLDEIGHPELSSEVITVGAMIETPRAALTAAALAEHADFFSFGTNDLTQMTYAFSRDDVEARLLPAYLRSGILSANPFAVLDRDGVGELVRIGCEGARATKPSIKLGVCGEHAGHPASADFLVRLGMDSVSCSPFRVPMARLGVAQSLLASGRVHIDDVTFDIPDESLAVDDAAQRTNLTGPAIELAGPAIEIDRALVLHTLRVRGFVTPDGFSASIGAHPGDILTDLAAAGHVRHIQARDMYGLLPTGKALHLDLLDQLADEPVRHRLRPIYEQRFLPLNGHFKQLCTDWQMRDGEPNGHDDEAYDRSCLDRLIALHAASRSVIDDFASVVRRFARYGPRFERAVVSVADGDSKQFTGVMCESFHDIWMELHEDLIVLLHIDRSEEGSY